MGGIRPKSSCKGCKALDDKNYRKCKRCNNILPLGREDDLCEACQEPSFAERRAYMASMMEEIKPFAPVEEKHVPMLRHQSRARRKNWMRNRPCSCGSGKKFKKCCWGMFTD